MNAADKDIEILKKLYKETLVPGANIKLILLKAFLMGGKFREEKIKLGINAVFENLHLPIK